MEGSPPRVWGKGKKIFLFVLAFRITPTCVGKRIVFRKALHILKDHPHVCGEKFGRLWWHPARKGSPPRVWGKVCLSSDVPIDIRITPTCVGKRSEVDRTESYQKDHPHVCGEKLRMKIILLMNLGSPPRVWGKAEPSVPDEPILRITPTCVGKSAYNVLSVK